MRAYCLIINIHPWTRKSVCASGGGELPTYTPTVSLESSMSVAVLVMQVILTTEPAVFIL